jgi:hypothetical protein
LRMIMKKHKKLELFEGDGDLVKQWLYVTHECML